MQGREGSRHPGLEELRRRHPRRERRILGRLLAARPVFMAVDRALAHWDLDVDGVRAAAEFATSREALDWGAWMVANRVAPPRPNAKT